MPRTFFTTAAFFARHGGLSGFKTFIDLCNQYPHDLRRVAHICGMSLAQTSKYRRRLCKVVYIPSPGAKEYLEHEMRVSGWDIEEAREVLHAADERIAPLQLIKGTK